MWFRSLLALLARSTLTSARQSRHAPRDRRRSRAFRPLLEILEDRSLPSTYTVNSLTDTGAGSGLAGDFRYCVTNATSGNDTITFAPGLTGTIQLQGALPTLNASVAIQGPGAQLITVQSDYYGFTVDGAAQVPIAGLTLICGIDIKDGSATVSNCTLDHGGISTDNTGAALTVSNCTVSDSAIRNHGFATVSYSTLSDSWITNDGSETISYSTISGYTGDGSAIDNSGNLTINNSTISGNRTVGPPAYSVSAPGTTASGGSVVYGEVPGGNGQGGGLYVAGGTVSINDSTFADNQAVGGAGGAYIDEGAAGNGEGGGLYIAGGTVSINNTTFADNQALGGSGWTPGFGSGGGIYNAVSAAALQVHDTILADNTATGAPDLSGGFASQGYNLLGNSSGGSGFAASDRLNVNPQLGPLQNNGGPTQTMALLTGSPAINAGDPSDNTYPNTPAYDQRGPGFPRIFGGRIDIGAFEVQNFSGLLVTGFPSVITAGVAGSFTITVLNADGSTDTGYTGTVHFSSSAGQASLPADYTFTAADAGRHTFSATLKTAGTQSITATDTTTAGFTATEDGITVNPAARKFILSAPASVSAGTAFSLTLEVEDAYGNMVTNYTGTVHFSSTDNKATLPSNYTFTAADKGVHTFTGLVLRKKGYQTITITDTHNRSLSGSVLGDVT